MNKPINNLSLHKQYNTFFDEQYISLIRKILNEGYIEFNNRTQTEIKALPQRTLVFNLINHIPVIGARKIFPHVAAAELAWTLQGTQNTTFIKKYSKMWTQFEDEPNKVVTAYGYRWRSKFNRDQLFDAIEALKKDRSNRQVWVTAWDAAEDGLLNIGKYKNMPCIIGFMLNTIGNKLNMSVVIRSSDTIVGLPYDTLMYAFLLAALAKSVGVPAGKLFILLNHAHIYANHYDMAQRMVESFDKYTIIKQPIDNEFVPQSIPIPQHNVTQILTDPDAYVSEIKALYKHSLDNIGVAPKLEFPDVIQ